MLTWPAQVGVENKLVGKIAHEILDYLFMCDVPAKVTCEKPTHFTSLIMMENGK